MEKDFYFILGISPDATTDVIKKAYRINAIKYHPDKNFGDAAFTKKFLEIKEAYDNLINPESRKEFDIKYKAFFEKKTTSEAKDFYTKREEKKQEEQKFKYNPYAQSFTSYDRKQQATPQTPPQQTPSGKPLDKDVQFPILPKNIGKIIGGVSNIYKGKKAVTPISLIKDLWKPFSIVIIITFMLGFFHYLYLSGIQKENPTQYVVIVWTIIASLLILGIYKLNSAFINFFNFNYFIGINGFAFYKFNNSNSTPIEEIAINFNDVTDLFSSHATLEFAWINRHSKKAIYMEPAHDEKSDKIKYAMNSYAEKYFTIYLLDNMEKDLEEKGYIEFIVAPFIPYIRLGIGFITFLKGAESFTYKFNEIKRVYTQEMQLYIEHINYGKILFFKSGHQDSIPLQLLYNRQFFYKAMEILLGYKIIE